MALTMLGYTPAKYTEPEFLDAIDSIVAAARKHGKKVGTLVADGEAAKQAMKRFDLVAIGTDVRAIQAFYGNALRVARS